MLSVWKTWPRLRRRMIAATSVFMFLDVDGTLVPLTSRPSRVRVSATVKRLLASLARRPRTVVAVISGRALADVQRLVGVASVRYAGNHGLELADQTVRYVPPNATRCRPLIARLARRLAKRLRSFPGAWLEPKGLTMSVHYRRVARRKHGALARCVRDVMREDPGRRRIRLMAGKRVWNIRPAIRWHKGTAVQWFVARHRARPGGAGAFIVYLGDDRTDEDAFRVVNRLQGMSVLVGRGVHRTAARYRLEHSRDVQRWLTMVEQTITLRKVQRA